MSNATFRKGQQLIKARRNANKKHTISTVVRKVAAAPVVKGATEALRKVAKKLRETGALGKVQTVIRKIDGKARKMYRYTAAQLAAIAGAYKPRKAEYKDVKAALSV